MPAGACNLDGPRTKSMDDETRERIEEALSYNPGFITYCDILADTLEIYKNTEDLEPHLRLGKITASAFETLSNEKGITDKRKSEIMGMLISHYRKYLKLD